MRALSYFVVLALLTGCGILKPSIRDVSDRPWREVQTEHFRIRTNLSEEAAERSARQLERFRRALLLLWGPKVNPSGSVDVVLLRNLEELHAFADSDIAGYFIYGASGNRLVFGAEGYAFGEAPALPELQMHELAHHVLYDVLGQHPRWLAEGLASYLETTRIKADGNVEMGRANARRYRYLKGHGRPSIETLWAWEPAPGESPAYYATSWALVHYLFNAEPRRFVDYLKRISSHESHEAAWAAAFPGLTPDELNHQLNIHLKHGRGTVIELPMPPIAVNVVLAPLSPEEVHTTLARLLLESPGPRQQEERTKLAREQLETALQANPDHIPAKQLRGALEQSEAN